MARKKPGDKQAKAKSAGDAGGVETPANVQADQGSIAMGGVTIGGDFSGEMNIATGDIIKNIKTIQQRALTSAEEAARARKLQSKLLAQGVSQLTQSLSAQASQGTDSDSPYKGLLSYSLNEAEIFYGRNEARQDLLNCLKQSPLTVLHAESGAGKSSLLQAGIAAQLIANGQLAIHLRPHNADPVDFIKRMFLPELTQAPTLAGASLHEFLKQVCAVLGSKITLYLLLDQFEEFFSLLDKNEREVFLESLADCLGDPSLKVRWVLALRAEALSKLAELESFGIAPFKNMYRLNRLNRTEAREAMVEPARRHGISFEPALIDHILDTLTTNDEVIPTHLQLVCSALTDDLPQQKGKTLTLTYYTEQEGDTEGILRDYLKRRLEDLPATEQALAWKVLRALITADRQRAVKTYDEIIQELKNSGRDREQIDTILARLIERRLLFSQPSATETFELAHDYLVKEIQLDPQEQARKAAQELLDQETRTYQRHKTLLTSERLAVIEPYQNELRVSAEAQTLLSESRSAAHRERRMRERRRNLTLGVSVAVAFGMALLALWGVTSSQTAREQEQLARAGELAAVANGNLNLDPELSLHLAMQSIHTTYTLQGEDALRRALLLPPVTLTLNGHSGSVYSVAYDSEGKRLVTASQDGTARIWDSKSGEEIMALRGHTGAVNGAVFSPDGQLVATAGADKTIRIWDAKTGRQLHIIEKHGGAINSVAFSPDGQFLVTASDDKTARVWEVESGKEIFLLDRNAAAVRRAVYSPNGEWIATGGNDATLHIWDAVSGQLVKSLPNYGEGVGNIAFSPDSQYVLTNYVYNALRWDITGEFLATQYLGGHTFYVTAAAFNPANGRQLVTASRDHTARLWDTESGHAIEFLRGHSGTVYSVAFDPSGDHLATASEDQTVRIWNIAEWRKRTLIGHTNYVLDAAYSFDGRRIATTSQDGTIRLWDSQSGRELKSWQPDWLTTGIAFSPDDRQLISSSDDGIWRIWDAETGKQIYAHTDVTNIVHDARFSPDGTRIITTNRDTFAYIWDASTYQLLHRLEGHTDWVASGMFSRDGKLVATASADATARVWDARTGKELGVFPGHSGLVLKAAFSSDGKRIVTAGVDGTARIWDVTSGKVLHILKGHTAEVSDATFSPDDKYVATASRDHTARLWNADTGDEIIQLFGHTQDVTSVAFSPDGHYLLTASYDYTARIYPVYYEDVMRLAQSLLSSRQLTCAELVKYLHREMVCSTPTP